MSFGPLAPKALGAVTAPSTVTLGPWLNFATDAAPFGTPWGSCQSIPVPVNRSIVFTHGQEAMRYALSGGGTYRLGLLAPPVGITATPTAVRATAVITFTVATVPANNDKISIAIPVFPGIYNSVDWVFKSTLSAGTTNTHEIKIGSGGTGAQNLAATIANLQALIGAAGVEGTNYHNGYASGYDVTMYRSTWNVEVSATTANTITIRIISFGTYGNSYLLSEVTDGGGTWSLTSFAGGSAGTGTTPAIGTFTYAEQALRSVDGALSAISEPTIEVTQESEGAIAVAGLSPLITRDATDYRRVDRSLSGGSQLFKAFDTTGTSGTDAFSDATISNKAFAYQYDRRIYRPRVSGYPTVGRYGAMWRGRLWVGGAHRDADITLGTAAVTYGSDTVTMTTVRVKENWIGKTFRVASTTIDYLIVDVSASANTIRLHRTYGDVSGDTNATASYTASDQRDPFALTYSEPMLGVVGLNNWPPQNQITNITSGDASGITGLAAMWDSLIAFTKTGVWRVTGNTGSFRLQNIGEGMGCFSGQALCVVGGLLYWLGPDGAWMWDGSGLPRSISKPMEEPDTGIQDVIGEINGDEAEIICANYNPSTLRIRWWVPTGTKTSNQTCLRYDLRKRRFSIHTASDVTAACTMPGPDGTFVTVVGDAYGNAWQLDAGYIDGAYGFEPKCVVSSYTVVTRTLAITGTTLTTSGSALAGVPVLIVNRVTGSYQMAKVATNTSGAAVLTEPISTAPTAGDIVIFGGIPTDMESARSNWDQPELPKWIEGLVLDHEVETVATEVWCGASADDDDAAVFTIKGKADVCDLTEEDGQHHFWLYTSQGRSLRYRILSFARGYPVRFRGYVLSVRAQNLAEVEG